MKRQFENLEQRMVNTYLDTFPPFVPSEDDGPGVEAQEQFYRFINGLYHRLADEPTLLFRNLHDDDAHTHRFNKGADNKPKLKRWMRKVVKDVDDLLQTMLLMGQHGRLEADALVVDEPVKVNKKHARVLAELGLHRSEEPDGVVLSHDTYAGMFPAWVWMATRPGSSLLDFSRCLFRERYPYASQVYARLSGSDAAFGRLETYLIEHGYNRMENWNGELTLDYYKTHGDKPPTKGGFQYGIHHTGVSAGYDLLMDVPPVFGLCIPRMKEILVDFAHMPSGVQDFVVDRTKKCDGCRYCVQTDKTGTRPLAHVRVDHNGTSYRLCPYYPGYSYCWEGLSDELVDNCIAMLDYMDRLFDGGPSVQVLEREKVQANDC